MIHDKDEWAPLEKHYGRKLTDEEKNETVNNLRAFFLVVGEVCEENRDYFDGLMDGVRHERLRAAKRLLRK